MKEQIVLSRQPDRRATILRVMDVFLGLAGLAAVAALVLEYGFREPLPVDRQLLHIVESVIVGIFVLDRFIRLGLAGRRLFYLRENWVDFLLILLAAVAITVSFRLHLSVLSAGALYVVITQVYILVSLILHGVSIHLRFAGSGIHPTRLLFSSFAVFCLVGSGLLMLPVATPAGQGASYIDALFTATSATCVTGLIVRQTSTEWTPFGQAVILALIQIGGLGIMMFGTILAMLVGKELSLRGSDAIGRTMSTDRIGRLGRTVAFVVVLTIALEIVGAIGFYPMFAAGQGPESTPPPQAKAVWDSVFHSVSSFCNAGFALYADNMAQGVKGNWATPLRNHWQIFGVMAPLIVVGGLGFPVLQDVAGYFRSVVHRLVGRLSRPTAGMTHAWPRPRLSLHSKIVLSSSALLIVLGAVGLLLVEPVGGPVLAHHDQRGPASAQKGIWYGVSWPQRANQAVFQSITARTAGFNTIETARLSNAGKLWMCGLMLIGGSPASTAGGMKTVTVALLVLVAYNMLRRRNDVEVFRRSVSVELLKRAVALAVLYLGLVAAITLGLCIAMRNHQQQFIDLLFEACSACGTVGLTTGVTSGLNFSGKCVTIVGMFIGRLGPLTLLLALASRIRHVKYEYPAETVVIG